MYKSALILLAIFMTGVSSASSEIQKTILDDKKEIQLSWKLTASNLSIVDSNLETPFLFKDISLENWQQSKTVGAASLPFKSFLFEGDPQDFEVTLDAKDVSFIDELVPAPAQKKPCRCDIVPWKFSADYKDEYYNRENLLHIKKELIGVFKGKKITKVSVYPIAYNHTKGARFVSEGTVHIKSKKSTPHFFKMKANDKNYNIFAHSRFESTLSPLIKLRKEQGFNVNFFALENIGHDSIGIKEFIHSLYEKEAFSYALIIGHEEEFPTEYVRTQFDMSTPSDMLYYTMDGEGDVIPDVLYGRLSVETTQELERVIEKTIEFENRSWENSTGASEMIAIASDEGSAPDDVEYVRDMQSPLTEKFNWKSNEFFQANESGNADNIVAQFNQGSIWLNYIGHGTGFEWPSVYGREFNTRDIASISSGKVKPVVIDVACQNGRFSNEGRMGETFIRGGEANSGAVAYYGGSVDISWDPPAIMAIGINRAVSENNQRRLVDVVFEGQSYLLENLDDREAALENFVWYHLQGDPLLNLSNLK
ncbi:C25 family cysteine peptidase [Halobacteriovorax sp. JY17]|uniref:C25 family cysteine peptidase n=1 Tax=Halobacteriovorax sp. JY17 TaxID=2014617 RepID=UPI000C53BD5D|nr:C25 family cysteine peptidase [Halobacteriovorax sp. JY17]PIK15901.1 MAG: hypothetical protein CES88_04020 [Halobacteriovorax sp. JY17]